MVDNICMNTYEIDDSVNMLETLLLDHEGVHVVFEMSVVET